MEYFTRTKKQTIMKGLSIEQKAKRYDEALEKFKRLYEQGTITESLCYIFPELAMSEDEKIREEIIYHIKNCDDTIDEETEKRMLAWLEKQGEQKPSDKVEPKFKVGDWVTNGLCVWRIDSIDEDMYYTNHCGIDCGGDIESIDKEYHLWTIQDAKNGDVLDANGAPFIYKKHSKDYVYFYCGVNLAGDFIEANGIDTWDSSNKVYPATKEQRDLLFKKMKEACYEWDAENKQLKKIDNEIEIPFGAKDSELQEATYYIPKGFHAEIEGNNVVIKKGEQKPAWSEEDECYMGECIGAIATKDGWSFEEKRKTKHWLKSMKERCSWNPSDEQITVLELASKYERVFTPKQIDILIGLKEQLKKLRGE